MTVTTITTLVSNGQSQITETVMEFTYSQALLEITASDLLLEATVLLVLNKSGGSEVRLSVPAAVCTRLLRSGASPDPDRLGNPVVFPEHPLSPGESWDGVTSCPLILRGSQQDTVQSVALPVRFQLLSGLEAGEVLELKVSAAGVTLEDGQVLSLQGKMEFSLEDGCLITAEQSSLQASPDGSQVETTTAWEILQTIRTGE